MWRTKIRSGSKAMLIAYPKTVLIKTNRDYKILLLLFFFLVEIIKGRETGQIKLAYV